MLQPLESCEYNRPAFPPKASFRDGLIFPRESRAVQQALVLHLKRMPDAQEIAQLRSSQSAQANSYFLYLGDVFIGTITTLAAKRTGDPDEFVLQLPARRSEA